MSGLVGNSRRHVLSCRGSYKSHFSKQAQVANMKFTALFISIILLDQYFCVYFGIYFIFNWACHFHNNTKSLPKQYLKYVARFAKRQTLGTLK